MKKLIFTIFILLVHVLGFLYFYFDKTSTETIVSKYPTNQISKDAYIDHKINSMNIEQKKGTLFMVSIPDKVLSEETITFLRQNSITGVILMPNNIVSEEQLKQLTSDLKQKVDSRIIISIDQEGGSVVRIPWDKYKNINARDFVENNTNGITPTEVFAYRAELLKSLGINCILGPVADIADKNSFLYKRSYGSNQDEVTSMIVLEINEYNKHGIITSPKHFPGHGKTQTDSHQDFPVINISKDVLLQSEFVPFAKSIESGTDFIMLGHIINPQIDPNTPASKSYKYIEILEQDLGFEGIVITDDLKMTGNINGGIDWGINLVIEDKAKIIKRINTINPQEKYVKRVLEIKYEKL